MHKCELERLLISFEASCVDALQPVYVINIDTAIDNDKLFGRLFFDNIIDDKTN